MFLNGKKWQKVSQNIVNKLNGTVAKNDDYTWTCGRGIHIISAAGEG